MAVPDDSKKGITYAGQGKLKKLPIPKLEDTIPRYLSAVKPFMVCDPGQNNEEPTKYP